MVVRVMVMMFVFVAHGCWLGEFVGRWVNKSNGGVRSSKIKVERALSDCCSALMRKRKFASSGFCWKTGSVLAASATPSPSMRVAAAVEGDDTALLENLAVDAAWRRRGVASALCAGIIAWAKSEGAWGLQLEVRVSNAAAQALYAELGFVKEGWRKKYYSDPEEDGVLMGLQFR